MIYANFFVPLRDFLKLRAMIRSISRIFGIGILLLASLSVSAETVKGSVIDSRGESMPFVTISVLDKDSTLLTGTITNDDGSYAVEVPAKKYILQASYIGYHTAFGGPDFVLREETERLEEVEVKAKKPLIERQMDKLVVNVSASPLSAGSNGNDILRRAPGEYHGERQVGGDLGGR